MRITDRDAPRAIAMWDFSWLERRYPGGGFEDWDRALDDLVDRGYDAVRIDAYPHHLAAGPDRTWALSSDFEGSSWGAPGTVEVQVGPALIEFIGKCADRDVAVGLSTWFREDETAARMDIEDPAELAGIWTETLQYVADAGLADQLCFVDLCNEFPAWIRDGIDVDRTSDEGARWLTQSVEGVREAHPEHDYTVSFSFQYDSWADQDVSALDFLELHLWMVQFSDFTAELGGFDNAEGSREYFDALAADGGDLYRSDPERWRAAVDEAISFAVEWSEATGLPIATTESWAVIQARDWPRLEWDWIKELNAYGTRRAAETGRWCAISTSNFCEPQFAGMWRDADWHRAQTDAIRSASVDV